ncbi:MAG TPA: tetratricopeptide repeat protein [Vicinamibacteria bacterium]
MAISKPPYRRRPRSYRRQVLVASSLSLVFLATRGITSGETLHLKNGRTIEVDRYWEEGTQLYYQKNGSTFGFPSSLLERVEQNAPPRATDPAADPTPDLAETSSTGFRNEPYTQAVNNARLSAEEGELDEASRYYRQALRAAPESVVARVELGELYIERGDLSAAQTELELAKRSAPEDPTVRDLLGDVYYGRGRTAFAIREWQKALELDPRVDVLDKLKKALQENDQDIEFDELRRPHFLIRYDGAVNELIGREIAVALESEYQDLTEELRFSPSAPVQVTLYTNREFTDVTHAPSWVSALNDGEIRIPVEGLTQLNPKVRGVLRPELTHTFINARTGNNCPTWFHEGFAQWRTGATPPGMYEFLIEAKESNALLPLWSLEGPLLSYSTDKARLVYLESLAATQYLVDRKGTEALHQILDLLARRYTMNDALNKVIGLDYQELQIAWEADLTRYRPSTSQAR